MTPWYELDYIYRIGYQYLRAESKSVISDSFQYVPVVMNDANEKQKERESQKNKTIVKIFRYYDILSEGGSQPTYLKVILEVNVWPW